MITVVLIVDVRILLLIIPLLFITVMLRKKIDNVEYECENDLALIDRRYEYYDKLIHHMLSFPRFTRASICIVVYSFDDY